MAQFVTFTDIDGLVTRINPDDVVSIYIKPSSPLVTVIKLNDNSTFLSNQSIAVLQSLFSPSAITALDTATLAALESISIQNGPGALAVNIQDGGNSITIDALALDTRPLNCATDSVTVCPGATPLQVVFAGTCGDVGISPVPVCFALDFASDKVDVSGSAVSITGTVATDDLTFANDKVDVSGSVITVTIEPLTFAEDKVDVSGSAVSITGTVTTDDLTFASDKVDVSGSTVTLSGAITTTIDFSYPEDSVHVSGDKGAFTLGVRNDAAAALTNNNGDYSPFATDSAGRIGIADLGGSITIDGSVSIIGTVPVSGPLTDTQLRATPVPVSGTVTITDGSGPVTVDGTITANQGTSPWVTSLDATTLAALESITVQNPGGASAVNIQDGGNSITVDGTVSISGTVNTDDLTFANDKVDVSGSSITIEALTFAEDKVDVSGSSVSVTGTVAVSGPLTDTQLRATPVPVSGTVAVSGIVATGDNKIEDAVHVSGDTGSFILAVRNDSNTAFTNNNGDYSPVAVNANGAIAINDGGNSITVDGTVAVSGTVAVTQSTSPWVTSVSGSVAVTGPLTDTQLRATPVPISGAVTIEALTFAEDKIDVSGSSVSITGTVGVTQSTSPWVVSGPLTDTQLRATAVPVSGPLTDTQLRATPVPISGTVTADTELPAATALADGDGNPTTSRVGANQLVFNGTTWDRARAGTALGSVLVNNPTAANLKADVSGSSITIEALTFAEDKVDVSGSSVSITGSVAVTGPLTDTQLRATAVPVSGPLTDTQLRATPVSISGTVTVTDGSGPLTVDGTVAATQSGSWSVTNLNGAGGAAVNIQDGGNSITVDGTVSISGTVAVTQSTTPWVVSQQAGTIANGAETAVSSSAVQILASNANRKKYIIQNTGTANIRVGTTGVTATTGARIVPNGTLLFEMPNCPTQAIFAIREGAVDSIAFAEEIT